VSDSATARGGRSLTSELGWSAVEGGARVCGSGWASDLLGRAMQRGREWAGVLQRWAARCSREQNRVGLAPRKERPVANWAGGWAKLSGPKAEVRKEKGNLFLFNFSKAIQNAIPTKFESDLKPGNTK